VAALKELLLRPGLRPQVVNDCCVLIDEEVASKSGVSGLALKAGYAVFKKVKKGALPSAVDWLLDDFVAALDRHHQDYLAKGEPQPGGFQAHLVEQKAVLAEDLLRITDARQEHSTNRAVRGAYQKLRPSASRYTQDAVPRVGAMVERYLAAEG